MQNLKIFGASGLHPQVRPHPYYDEELCIILVTNERDRDMKKVLKWIGIVLGSLIGLLALVVLGLLIYGQISFKPRDANRPLHEIAADTSPEGQGAR